MAHHVSVIVPTRNSAATLDACLDSIRTQTVRVELIVVDNGSTDGSASIAARYADRVIEAGPERSAQRNIGARAARGDILLFIDSDMVLPPDLADSILEAFGDGQHLDALVIPEHSFGEGFWAGCKALEKQLYLGDAHVEAARAFRRDAFLEVGGFDEELFAGEDWDLAERVDPTGATTGRVRSTILHDEGRLTLREDLRKKLYYGRSLRHYVKKGDGRLTSRFLRASVLRRWPEMLRHPLRTVGLIVMKTLELAAALTGMAFEALPRSIRLSDPVRRRSALTFALPLILTLIVVQTWFQAGTFIASGDVSPFIRDNIAAESSSVWSHSLTGGGSASFEAAARTPELLTIKIAHAVGASNETAQRVFYTVLALAVVASAIFLARTFVPPGFAAGLAGLVALFNPYMLQNLPNPLPMTAITIMALSAGILLRAARGDTISPLALVAVSLLTCYLALNPPLLAVVAGWAVLMCLVASAIVGSGGTRRAARLVVRAMPWVVLVNLWWLVPYALTFASAGNGFGITAETDIRAWAWTQARLSIPNVLTVSGGWGWRYPEYFPYASSLDRGAWASLKFGLPAVAILAVPFTIRDRRRVPIVFVSLVLALTFLAKGIHPPFSEVNLYLYDHVPGLWLLREPLSKLGLALVLCYVVLIGMAVSAVGRLARENVGSASRAARTITTGIAIGALLYPSPLWTGRVISDEHPILPPEHVALPAAWRVLAEEVNTSPIVGKAIVLPLDDFYQMPTTWGYYGVDSIPRSLLERPTIQPLPGGYYGELPGYAALLESVETALNQRDIAAIPRVLRSLGVSHIIVRDDLDPAFASRPMPDPAPLEETLASTPGIEAVGDFGVAHLYELRSLSPLIGTVDQAVLAPELGAEAVPLVVGAISGVAVVDGAMEGRSVGAADTATPLEARTPLELDAGPAIAAIRAVETQSFEITNDQGADGSALVLRPMSSVVIGSDRFASDPFRIDLPPRARVAAIGVNGHVVPVEDGPTVLGIPSNASVTAYGSSPADLSSRLLLRVVDCHAFDDRSIEDAGLSATALPDEPGLAVRLQARTHSACVTIPVRGYRPGRPYEISFGHRTLGGSAARVCVFEKGPNVCASTPRFESSSEWSRYRAVIDPDPGTTALQLIVYADGGRDPSVTTTEYRDIGASALTVLKTEPVHLDPPSRTEILVDRSVDGIVLPTPTSAALSTELSDVLDCNAYDLRTIGEVGIASHLLSGEPGPGVRLEALDHAACVSATVEGFVPGASYVADFDYRTVSGRTPRICLWMEGSDRCASMPPLETVPGWQSYHASATPLPGTLGLRLFLYADGGGEERTVVEYRNLSVRAAPAFAAAVIQMPQGGSAPPAAIPEQIGSSSYRVAIQGSDDPFLLVLRESYAEGWELIGVPSDRIVRHVMVDGYANGWWISPGPSMTLGIGYAPEAWARSARMASTIAIAALLATIFVRYRRRRRGAEMPEGREPAAEAVAMDAQWSERPEEA